MSLYCTRSGQGADLLLLHGWGMNGAVWQPLLPWLEPQFRISNVDLPGHGRSPALELAEDASAEAVLNAWLDALAGVLPERFYLCGWSLGGSLALAIQQRWPERVRGVLLLAASPRLLATTDWPALPAAHLQRFADSLRNDTSTTLRQFLALQFLGVKNGRAAQRACLQGLLARGQASAAGLEQGLQLLRELDLRAAFAACPCAVALGQQDKLVPVQLAAALQQLNPAARIVQWRGLGHAPQLVEPQRVAQFIGEQFAHD